ncbi:MAG: Respiratory-chain NADH dehydrogenase domain 51 kDa subunit [Candidatus Uhrbacteria bacterium GW2011_GWE2_40_58]|nr:MAG: Respiratory-chain NADH dehydrogenase domain 51 kDa subunit [Candidatus Uhrbacteria bacterium GW2011_GWF2_40_263]KKR68254.1 MAG: Respiratory-chain NADH dehydrogenase domain 51 kDa subunit [Candidatus Uhrbacteria bacterium GW2011_GWE2_40_58]OGL92056.1 MAG: hypothetical protein A2239_03525 [Candidatus Uhrbacteria bacterium RIFOXYA2_FULL_40_9]OGL97514.1 MAG: hypothetical protein A2332_00230 [Candidatus Uhrbacteria bacterium RIFOXYB2_FULL_41_18]HBK35098.1 hypothetical protein [Candidatus Uhr
MSTLLEQIKEAGLVGRGGAEFPTWKKWEGVKNATGDKKYVICNASEGELGLFKDIHILEHHLEQVFKGLKCAMDFLDTGEAYFNFNQTYYERVKEQAEYLVRQYKKDGYTITFYKEEPSYIGGEETALLEAIEGRRTEPRLKPPYPSDAGLFGMPTLIHNVETLFDIASVADSAYEHKRFYCVSEGEQKRSVHHLPAHWSVMQILEEIEMVPLFDYFVQIGGSISGLVLASDQLDHQPMIGAGSIEIYPLGLEPLTLLKKWFDFYATESCGKCTPCKMGSYNLSEMLKGEEEVPWNKVMEIIEVMEKTSFCALGRSVATPVKSYRKNILKIS